jgi:hypothetical protein
MYWQGRAMAYNTESRRDLIIETAVGLLRKRLASHFQPPTSICVHQMHFSLPLQPQFTAMDTFLLQ